MGRNGTVAMLTDMPAAIKFMSVSLESI